MVNKLLFIIEKNPIMKTPRILKFSLGRVQVVKNSASGRVAGTRQCWFVSLNIAYPPQCTPDCYIEVTETSCSR